MDATLRVVEPEYTPVGLVMPKDMTWDRWQEMGKTLDAMEFGLPWWWGDWLNFGETSYGETYAQAIAITGHKIERLQNYKWVSGKVPPENRLETLSWTHHRYVAKVASEHQLAWLRLAEAEGWSSREMLSALKAANVLPQEKRVDLEEPVTLVPPRWVVTEDDRVLITQNEQAVMLSREDVARFISWFMGEGQWLEN